MNYDPMAPRVPYALPASHKGYSAYSRETYTGGELQYRGKDRRTVERELERADAQRQLYCDPNDDRVTL